MDIKQQKRIRRHKRIRAKVSGTSACPRLAVYKSNTRLIAQMIDDEKEKTLLFASDDTMKGKNKTERAKALGKEVALQAGKKKIKSVVFDRGGFLYAGRMKAFTEGAREGGLAF